MLRQEEGRVCFVEIFLDEAERTVTNQRWVEPNLQCQARHDPFKTSFVLVQSDFFRHQSH